MAFATQLPKVRDHSEHFNERTWIYYHQAPPWVRVVAHVENTKQAKPHIEHNLLSLLGTCHAMPLRKLNDPAHQRCLFHKITNIADHLVFDDLKMDGSLDDTQAMRNAKQARKQAIWADAGRMYAGDGEADIRVQAAAFRATWEGREPKAVAN